eukprot:2745354-Prymnesium_polylepis.1
MAAPADTRARQRRAKYNPYLNDENLVTERNDVTRVVSLLSRRTSRLETGDWRGESLSWTGRALLTLLTAPTRTDGTARTI